MLHTFSAEPATAVYSDHAVLRSVKPLQCVVVLLRMPHTTMTREAFANVRTHRQNFAVSVTQGGKKGETWSVDGAGHRYQRWWGEEHFGNGWVRRFGNSTTGVCTVVQ